MRASVLANWIPFNTAKLAWTDADGTARTSPNEGLRFPSWMYEDILGLMTTGMGNLIEDRGSHTITDEGLNAGWVRANGTLANQDEIRAEFARLKAAWAAQGLASKGGFNATGRALATLWLPQPAVQKLIAGALLAFESDLKRQFPAWDSFPADAQLAMLSMCWAQGGGFQGWPKFRAAVNSVPPRWRDAAQESFIHTYNDQHQEVPNAGLVPRNRANARLFLNAEGVLANNLNPDSLYFPTIVGNAVMQNPAPDSGPRSLPRIPGIGSGGEPPPGTLSGFSRTPAGKAGMVAGAVFGLLLLRGLFKD